MRCANCGADIPEGMMICPDCCTEVQIVPDYNPLDDVLVREVRGSVEGTTRQINTREVRTYRGDARRQAGNSTRVLNQNELSKIRSSSNRNNDRRRQTAGHQNTEALRRREAEERRRQKMLWKKKQKQKRIKMMLFMVIFVLAIVGACGVMLYQNSYDGIVKKGYHSLQLGEYSAAKKYFNKAISKNQQKAEAYTGLSEVYIEQKDLEKAENVFLNAVETQTDNAELYKSAVAFYVETEQLDKISSLLDGCSENVATALEDYVSEAPEFSLEEGTYTEVQEVSLTGEGEIYYTTDGSDPDESSTLYEEPILLDEGTTLIKAVCINKKEITSLVSKKKYVVALPIADAPAVTPSTGQYSTPTQIVISVPDGYTAYYTMDGSTPTAASKLYTGPIDMPTGQTTFSAVLLSKSGKLTSVTKRSYLLEY